MRFNFEVGGVLRRGDREGYDEASLLSIQQRVGVPRIMMIKKRQVYSIG